MGKATTTSRYCLSVFQGVARTMKGLAYSSRSMALPTIATSGQEAQKSRQGRSDEWRNLSESEYTGSVTNAGHISVARGHVHRVAIVDVPIVFELRQRRSSG